LPVFLLGVRTCTERQPWLTLRVRRGGIERQLHTLKGSLPALKGSCHTEREFASTERGSSLEQKLSTARQLLA